MTSSHLSYGVTIRGNSSKKEMKGIFFIQKKQLDVFTNLIQNQFVKKLLN